MMGPFDSGALVRYPKKLTTPSNLCQSQLFLLYEILVMSSLNTIRSMMMPAANKLSSQTLQHTKLCSPPMKISLVYQSMAFLVSPAAGTYLITTVWSGYSSGCLGSYISEFQRISLMHSDLEAYFDLNCFSEARFLPSLLPKWLQETHDFGLIPALVKKSMKDVLNLVWPDLKSFPIRRPGKGDSLIPLTKVFWGDPLMKTQFSWRAARAKIVEGAISGWLSLIALTRFSQVSLIPGSQRANLSVLAVQSRIMLFRLFSFLKVAISWRMSQRWTLFQSPSKRLLALSSWLAAMKSGQQILFMGLYYFMNGYSFCCSSQSNTCALFMADAKSMLLMSQPVTTSSSGLAIGMTSLSFIKIQPSGESATFMVEH